MQHPEIFHPEYEYLNLLEAVLSRGIHRPDRTGTGTNALFGTVQKYDLSFAYPLLTTKQIAWKKAIAEILWIISGSTNIRPLLLQDTHIWSAWPHKSYVETTGDQIDLKTFEARIISDTVFAERYGSIGQGAYGKQYRNYTGGDGSQHDQILRLVEGIARDPYSRRHHITAWNPAEVSNNLLPPCVVSYTFSVANDRLHLTALARSSDLLLGNPWNIFEASVLVTMIAQQCDLEPGTLTFCVADAHLYQNHFEQAHEQLARQPRGLPKLSLLRKPDAIDAYSVDDFTISDYDPWPAISAPVAV